jgi:MSHA pilin protein MshD
MSRRYIRGFTLIELIIFIVVVGAGLAGILSVSTTVVKSSADPMVRKQALTLADSILEEVLQKEYTDPDGVQGNETNRATMDDVDDYNGKTQALFTDWPVSLSGYLVTISVAAPAAMGGTVTVQAKKVTVVVTRGPESVTLVGYRAQY